MPDCGVCGIPEICRDHGCQEEAAEYERLAQAQADKEYWDEMERQRYEEEMRANQARTEEEGRANG